LRGVRLRRRQWQAVVALEFGSMYIIIVVGNTFHSLPVLCAPADCPPTPGVSKPLTSDSEHSDSR